MGGGAHHRGWESMYRKTGKAAVMTLLWKLGSKAKGKVIKRRGWKRIENS